MRFTSNFSKAFSNRRLTRGLTLVTGITLLGIAFPVFANPSGGGVVAGTASIAGKGSNLVTVTQSSDRAIVNWGDFSIGAGETTKFTQPGATSAILNRVVSGNPSSLLGSLVANGRVYLINPNGVLVGKDAVIDTKGFLV